MPGEADNRRSALIEGTAVVAVSADYFERSPVPDEVIDRFHPCLLFFFCSLVSIRKPRQKQENHVFGLICIAELGSHLPRQYECCYRREAATGDHMLKQLRIS
jgi:hypothetical protein